MIRLRYVYIYVLFVIFIISMGDCLSAVSVSRFESKYKIAALGFHDKQSRFVDLNLTFAKAGCAFDPPKKSGLAAMLAMMAENGFFNKNKTAKQFDEFLKANNISVNTRIDKDNFYITLSSWAKNLGLIFELLNEFFMNDAVDDLDFNKAMDFMMANIDKQKEDPSSIALNRLNHEIYSGHPYANPCEGTEESIKSISSADIVRHAKKIFNRLNLNISIAGFFDEQELTSCLDRYLSDLLLTSTIHDLPKVKANSFDKSRNVKINMKIPNKLLLFSYQMPGPRDADRYSALILNHILGGNGLFSMLSQEIRVKRAMTYGIRTAVVDHQASSIVVGNAFTVVDNVDSLVHEIEAVFAQIKKGVITKEVFDGAKKSLVDRYYLGLTGNMRIAQMINHFQLWDYDNDYINIYPKDISGVTYEDFLNFIKVKSSHSFTLNGVLYIGVANT